MAYESRIEDILSGVKDYVKDNIDTFLEGITSEKDDDISLPSFKEYAVDDRDPYNRGKYPVCLLAPGKGGADPASMNTDCIGQEIQIIICITEGNKGRIITEIERYVEAFRQLFVDDPTCDGAVDDIVKRIDWEFFPTLPGQSDKKIAIITVTVQKDVNR